ncbi:MAG: PSD1 and planctomycete cytochrome C domain-containing protein [Bacteroidales bacterium]|nr:PSD1 and planctomycete cytochrome C domain-containing protein [Bacteroidales bacterium]
MMRTPACLLLLGFAMTPTVTAQAPQPPKPDFNRDVRPILSEHCYKCHGPGTQKAGVRLDTRNLAQKKDAVVSGHPETSGIIERIAEPDDELRMPPAEAGRRLTAREIATLRAWITHGAEYAPHWAFVPPVRPPVPDVVKTPVSPRNPIDHFLFQRLRQAGLTPSPPAERTTLIRRVTLDLIGLLPSPAEVDAFVNDSSPDAYEKLVDRLLASPHYGERQARHWLDLARYADSNGYTIDGARSIWPYRDWVIQAYNADLPFDQFTIQQLAGDLLPQPTKEQLIATGFHRNTSYNEEGGTDREQFRVERTIDRTNTTGAVWLGLTVGCAQCHDHKYDPVSQKEYYSLYAFFDNCDEPVFPIGGRPDLDQKLNTLDQMREQFRQAEKTAEVKKIEAAMRKLRGQLPTTLIIRESRKPHDTFVQIRGDFLRKGDRVTPTYPVALASASTPSRTRLDLARWLVSAENPLTARVTVNREWQKFFGLGLVDTENDFGMQGSLPTHPQLLDWLAVEFRETGWSIKQLHKRIVMSASYQQSSQHRADLSKVDQNNKLLGRQNRLRVEAEIIRDAALSASGMLTPKIGGPGVHPPLPAEVFAFTQNKKPWPEERGPNRYRRGMYTYIWRQSQHHLLTTFDAADAQTACTRRNRSNTPLQALHLANDPAFLEFYAGLGQRLQKDGPKDDVGKVDLAFRLCLCREPSVSERERVLAYLQQQRKQDANTAWAQVARVLMNLDEFVTRE